MSKHTHGPWVVYNPLLPHSLRSIVKPNTAAPNEPPNGLSIAHVDNVAGHADEPEGASEANARLIAAAPELLTVCEAILEECRRPGHMGEQISIPLDDLEVAIAKAKGEG